MSKKLIGVFGTCRIDNWLVKDFKKTRDIYPYIFENDKIIIYIRPLGYTIGTSDVYQNIELIRTKNYGKYKDLIKNNYHLKRQIFLKHGGKKILFNINYDLLIIEVCGFSKIIHKETGLQIPYMVEKDDENNYYNDNPEDINETTNNILSLAKRYKNIILLPPIIEINTDNLIIKTNCKNMTNKDIVNKIKKSRTNILNRIINIANLENNIYVFNTNDIIKKFTIEKMILDQVHYTEYGKKKISESLLNFIEKNNLL